MCLDLFCLMTMVDFAQLSDGCLLSKMASVVKLKRIGISHLIFFSSFVVNVYSGKSNLILGSQMSFKCEMIGIFTSLGFMLECASACI